MNPLTNMKNVIKLSESDLKFGLKSSWHDQYKDSAWIFVGGIPYDLTEGDLICVFSQYGEIVNINLVRDKLTGKQKGYCFICYEDQRSTILAVDNLNGIKILGKSLRVDHVNNYKAPKDNDKLDDETKRLHLEGCGPKLQIPADKIKKEPEIVGGVRLPQRLPIGDVKIESNADSDIRPPQRLPVKDVKKEENDSVKKEHKKQKKAKKDKSNKKSKKKKKRSRSLTNSDSESDKSIDYKRNKN